MTLGLEMTDLAHALAYGERLFSALREGLTDVAHVKALVERLGPHAPAFPEVRFCKGGVLPIVDEVTNRFLVEEFKADRHAAFRSLRCEGFANLSECYQLGGDRTGFSGSPWNRTKQPLSKCGTRAGSTANPDFCVRHNGDPSLRLVGEVKYSAKTRQSASIIAGVVAELRYYMAILSDPDYGTDWGHDFGFGVIYCAGGDAPRRSRLILDNWESDGIMIASFDHP